MNDKDYFQKVVAKGNIYTKVVKKDMKSLEDQAVTADVVETYIPIMRGDTFLGAFEIYYDITQRNKKLDIVKFYSSSMALVMMCIFLGVIVVSLLKLDRNIIKRRQTEEKLKVFASKLEKSNQNLEEFAYIASHDLQEPLRKVVTFGDQLKKKYHEVLGEQGNDYLDRMQNATRRMQTFINDLLAISRVTTQAQSFASVDLGKVAKEVISDLEVRIQQTGGRVEIGELPAIEADALQMRQLLQNLIVNALKFHKKDEPPVVRVSGTLIRNNGANAERNVSHDESCQVTFEDNGIGFDEKYADRIFGVFQRLHGRNQYEGSGIGLSICKKIVERHGGTITAKSAPGKGTTFIITLPAKHKGEE
jgi:light-regulated signal transduction histidine kinase (bacteriophytochrome)